MVTVKLLTPTTTTTTTTTTPTTTTDDGHSSVTKAHPELCSGELKIAPRTEANARLLFPKSIKGDNSVKMPQRVMALGQIVALVMVNNRVKFH